MKFDNIERLFRGKFKEPSSDDLDWIDPSDAIFEKALASYKEDDNNRKPLFWRLGVSGLFLALVTVGAFFFWNGQNGSSDVQPIVAIPDEVVIESSNLSIASSQSLSGDTNIGINQTIENNNENNNSELGVISQSDQQLQKNESLVAGQSPAPRAGINTKRNIVPQQSEIDAYHNDISGLVNSGSDGPTNSANSHVVNGLTNDVIYDLANVTLEQPSEQTTLSSESPMGVKLDQSDISILPLLAIGTLARADSKLPVLEQNIIPSDEVKFTRSNSISLAGGRNYSSISHNADEFRHLMELGGNRALQGGWSIGADFRTDINSKWILIGGVSFNRINMQAWTRSNSTFNSNFASVIDGRSVFNTDVGFVSPTTGFIDNAEFVIEDIEIETGDIFDHNMQVDQDISIITASVGIGRRLIQSNKFALTSELSVGFDYITHIQESLNLEVSYGDEIVYQKQSDWVNLNGINRTGANVGINLRAELLLSDRFSLFLSPSYRRSLTSIKNSEIIQTRSYYNLFNLSTGVAIRF